MIDAMPELTERQAELAAATRSLIAQMARRAIGALSQLPHDDRWTVHPSLAFAPGIVPAGKETHILPREYIGEPFPYTAGALVQDIHIRRERVALHVAGRTLGSVRDLSIGTWTLVTLAKPRSPDERRFEDDLWFHEQRTYGISTRGGAISAKERSGLRRYPTVLAAAGIVARVLEHAQGVKIGQEDAADLYTQWLTELGSTPRPVDGAPFWTTVLPALPVTTP
ncbi:MAG TPA: hypothetical protein VLH84_00415 [Patescibacteria group bacterium]|nr:hypothetical protein [Patescibacteria group bacterium]